MYEGELKQIDIENIQVNSLSPNRMSKNKFNRLVENIRRMGIYEPVVVRPVSNSKYEIINGYHRIKALEKLGYTKALAIVWEIDEMQACIFLASLNRLTGVDIPDKKAKLLRYLTDNVPIDELSKLQPLTKQQIQKMISFEVSTAINIKSSCERVDMPESIFFFMEPQQKKILDSTISLVLKNCKAKTKAQKNAEAITQICKVYKETIAEGKHNGNKKKKT